MRIVSGKHKGRSIPVRKNFPSRPTTDFAKENIFNVINNYFDFEDLDVLDLFSGTGSICYEFASRGCKSIHAVEKDFQSTRFIKSVIDNLKLENIKIIKADAFKYIEHIGEEKYNIVFADPPYDLENLSQLPELIIKNKIIKKEGWFILEHGKNHQFNDIKYFNEVRKYGSVHFSIFKFK